MNTTKILLTALIGLSALDGSAAVKVKKVSLTNGNRDAGSSRRALYVVCCDSHSAKITSDGNGGSLIYIDENGNGTFDASERTTLADIRTAFEREDLEWQDISIALSATDCPADNVATLTMDGGVIGSIYAGTCDYAENEDTEAIRGTINVNLLGGEIEYFSAYHTKRAYSQNQATVSVVMSGITYTGYEAPMFAKELTYSDTDPDAPAVPTWIDNLVIVNNCRFLHSEAQPSESDYLSIVNGAMVQTTDQVVRVYANNATTPFLIPSCVNVTTPFLTDQTSGNKVQNEGSITVTQCNGFTKKATWTGAPNVVEHDYVDEVYKAATCEEDGMMVKRCTKCHGLKTTTLKGHVATVFTKIPALLHSEDIIIARPATCVAAGWTQGSSCSRCGKVFQESTPIAATGHNWAETRPFSLGCTQDTEYMCRKCNSVKVEHPEYHDWEEETIEGASCHEFGYTHKRCKRCNYARMHLLRETFLPHDLVANSKPATCTEPGYETYYTCAYDGCNRVFTTQDPSEQGVVLFDPVVIQPTGHNFIEARTDYALKHERTCDGPATFYMSCRVCHELKLDETFTVGNPLGHNYAIEDNSLRYDSEDPQSGRLTLTCDRCNQRWPHFPFSASRVATAGSTLSYNCFLRNIQTKPSCRPGRGVYKLVILYGGQTLSTTYQAPILPVYAVDAEGNIIEDQYLLHHWDSHGHCATHPDEPIVAGYISYLRTVDLGNGHFNSYVDGCSFADADALLQSTFGGAGTGSNYEAEVFDYTLTDGTLYQNIIQADVLDRNFTYERNFTTTAWQSLYVPVAIPVSALTEQGLDVAEIYNVHQYDEDNDGQYEKTNIDFLRLTAGSLEPNRPYVIRALEPGQKSLQLSNVRLQPAIANSIDCSTTRQNFTFTGTYEGVTGADMYSNDYYAMTSAGAIMRASGPTVSLKPQRWYMDITNRDGSPVVHYAPIVRISVDGVEEEVSETALLQLLSPEAASEALYNLGGQRVKDSDVAPGIYMQGGKKVVIR